MTSTISLHIYFRHINYQTVIQNIDLRTNKFILSFLVYFFMFLNSLTYFATVTLNYILKISNIIIEYQIQNGKQWLSGWSFTPGNQKVQDSKLTRSDCKWFIMWSDIDKWNCNMFYSFHWKRNRPLPLSFDFPWKKNLKL